MRMMTMNCRDGKHDECLHGRGLKGMGEPCQCSCHLLMLNDDTRASENMECPNCGIKTEHHTDECSWPARTPTRIIDIREKLIEELEWVQRWAMNVMDHLRSPIAAKKLEDALGVLRHDPTIRPFLKVEAPPASERELPEVDVAAFVRDLAKDFRAIARRIDGDDPVDVAELFAGEWGQIADALQQAALLLTSPAPSASRAAGERV